MQYIIDFPQKGVILIAFLDESFQREMIKVTINMNYHNLYLSFHLIISSLFFVVRQERIWSQLMVSKEAKEEQGAENDSYHYTKISLILN